MRLSAEQQRSQIMRAVKDKNTAPEMLVRKIVFSMGFRYRLHRPDLPGKPDLVFSSKRKVIFVHGCFWHGHDCARGARIPKQNAEYWIKKIARNKQRDLAHLEALRAEDWKSLAIWECKLKNVERLRQILWQFLSQDL